LGVQEWGAAHSAASETPSFFAAPIVKGRADAMDGDASFAHASQHRGECHVRQRPARACVERGEHEFVDADACHMMEQGRSRFAERHSLLAAGGVIHVRASQSISAHVALRTSFVRQAVRIVKASPLTLSFGGGSEPTNMAAMVSRPSAIKSSKSPKSMRHDGS
jgi:hypothetical protein